MYNSQSIGVIYFIQDKQLNLTKFYKFLKFLIKKKPLKYTKRTEDSQQKFSVRIFWIFICNFDCKFPGVYLLTFVRFVTLCMNRLELLTFTVFIIV